MSAPAVPGRFSFRFSRQPSCITVDYTVQGRAVEGRAQVRRGWRVGKWLPRYAYGIKVYLLSLVKFIVVQRNTTYGIILVWRGKRHIFLVPVAAVAYNVHAQNCFIPATRIYRRADHAEPNGAENAKKESIPWLRLHGLEFTACWTSEMFCSFVEKWKHRLVRRSERRQAAVDIWDTACRVGLCDTAERSHTLLRSRVR